MRNLSNEFWSLYTDIQQHLLQIQPFNLVDLLKDEYEDEDDLMFDLPYAFTTDKNGHYMIHMVVAEKLKDNTFRCLETGEQQGEEFILTIDEIPVESLFSIYDYLKE